MDNTFSVVLCKESELVECRRVFSASEIAPVLSIHVPYEYFTYSRYAIHQISDSKHAVDISRYVRPRCSPAWLDIYTCGLDVSPGQHDYVVRYYDPSTSSYIWAYFGYIIQTENTNKSYVYMKREQ